MKISTKGRYALRLMLDMAENDSAGPVKLKDISSRQMISVKYLEQIISVLNKADYVQSVRGAQGGYHLSKKPEEYTVGMILRTTEGSLAPVSCVDEGVTTCERQGKCVTFRLYEEINAAVNGVVDRITLADLVEWDSEEKTDK